MRKFLLLTFAGAVIFILTALGLIVFGNTINWSIFWALIFVLGLTETFFRKINCPAELLYRGKLVFLTLLLFFMFFYLIRITSSNVAFTAFFFILIILVWSSQ